ncbi:MAG: hypothetical protein NZ927_06885 [Candidatus Calescibacterium sp.]|nr:hypothetical protein [Candidatus Calescibacterium sp.]MCX7734528.1 hypothetical protein [bacterium]MDW8087647.1 hypothetical protein [Candidatus Calescibacterium sp.]
MEIFKKDSIAIFEKGDDLRESFIMCAENGFVLPFLPIFQANTQELFFTSMFIKQIFDFPTSYYILGFELTFNGKKIKYGGKVHITNTGINLTSIFFAKYLRELINEKKAYLGEKIELNKLFVKLIPRAHLIFAESSEKSVIEKILSINKYPKIIFKNTNLKFFIPIRYPNSQKSDYEKIINLPEDYKELLKLLEYLPLYGYPENVYNPSKIHEFAKQNRKLVLIVENNYLIPLYVRS